MELLSRELLNFATDEEIEVYLGWLEAELDLAAPEDDEWVLQDRQQTAEDALEDLDPTMSHELLYGGAAGPGKTEFALWHGYNACLTYPGLRVLMLRRTFPELRRSLVLRSLERFDRSKTKYSITESTWKFTNGSYIEFGYCETDNDVYQYQSAEYDIVIWDELTQWKSSFPYLYLFSRCRSRMSTMARGFVPHVVACTNPGGIGGGWVKARFVDTSPPNVRKVHELTDDDGNPIDVDGPVYGTRIFVPGLLDDNRFINKRAYVANLANLPQAQREALLGGSWDVIEGQYFTMWNRDLHVIEPFAIPAWWTRVRGVDYGYRAPFCCLWIAFDGDGTAYMYRELYKTQLTPVQQCAQILAVQAPGEHIASTPLDPSCFSRTGVGVPIAQQYVESGVPVRRALNARVDGWMRVIEYLRPIDGPPAKPGGRPSVVVRLKVFSTCVNFIRTFPMLVHDTTNPEDLDSDGEDHAADALRYLLMSRPPPSRKPLGEAVTLEAKMAESRKIRELERSGKRGVMHPDLGRI